MRWTTEATTEPPAGAGPPGSGVQALEDLADGHPLVDEPAVEHADDLGLGLVDDQVAGHAVALGDVAVAVGRLAADELPLAAFWSLPRRKRSPEQRPLVLGDRPLDLEQELVVGVVGDGAMDEDDLAAGLANSSRRSTW